MQTIVNFLQNIATSKWSNVSVCSYRQLFCAKLENSVATGITSIMPLDHCVSVPAHLGCARASKLQVAAIKEECKVPINRVASRFPIALSVTDSNLPVLLVA